MLSLYSWCRNAGGPHFFDIALVGTPWRVGSRAMNHINPMSLSLSLNPSSRKRTRADLSQSDDDKTHTDSDSEHEQDLSKKPPRNANFPRFIVLKPTYSDQSLTKLSPFAVKKSILGRYGTVKQVKKLKDGSLLIEVEKYIQAQLLFDTQTFLDIEVDAEAHRYLNVSKGVIRDHHQDLKDMTDGDIRLELSSQGVLKVTRFILKKDGKEIKTNTLFVTFDFPTPPEKLKLGYVIVNVQRYIPNPLRCFQCQRFGHSKKWCKNTIACLKCGSEGHDGSERTSKTSCCLNCKGDHYRLWGLHRGTCTPRGTFCHYVGLVGGCPLTTKWGMPRPESVVLLRYRGSKFDLPKNYTRKPRNDYMYVSSKSYKLFASFAYHYFFT